VPIAIETAVNYLRPRADELGDGEFVAAVAERADCGILLDLHNIYCNALNGRQSVDPVRVGAPAAARLGTTSIEVVRIVVELRRRSHRRDLAAAA